MTITEFIEARLAEDWNVAHSLMFACRIPDKQPDFFACGGPAAEQFWGHFDPARMLRDIETKRAMVKLHDRMSILPRHPMFNDEHLTRLPMVLCRSCEPETMFRRETSWPCRTLRTLAADWNGHPDYRQEWKP